MNRNFSTPRRGAILLIVLVLLALFAVVGLAFVIYAQSEATNSRIHREIQNSTQDAPPDPNPAVTSFLQQLIYPVPDGNGVASALRGHELARGIYGYNPSFLNTAPYSGIGTFSQTTGGLDRRDAINYTGVNSTDTVLDPEHTGTRTAAQILSGTVSTGNYVGKNAPYTYPDRNNAFLAMQDPATGQIVIPSFHRPALFGSLDSFGTTANANWTNVDGRKKILRPRPFDHQFDSGDSRGVVSDFPYPPPNSDGTVTGDVQNIRWQNNVQKNDSVWIHANLPPVLYRGRYVQPLVAATILPLDGRLNFNVAGNHRDSGNGHASNQGYGPYEMNPQKVLVNPPTSVSPNLTANESQFLVYYRYGNNYRPTNASGATAQTNAWHDPTIVNGANADYSPYNFDAFNAPYAQPISSGLRCEPFYTVNAGYDNNLTSNRHQSLYNPYFCTDVSVGGGRTLRMFDLRQTAYRYSGKQSVYAPPIFGFTQNDSSFTGSSPNHPSNVTRANTTTISNSVNCSGVMPSFSVLGNFQYPATSSTTAPAPTAPAQTFNPTAAPTGGDTIPGQGYRSAASLLGPIDLNRPLDDYRTNKLVPLTDPANLAGMAAQFPIADAARQEFARDIFERLVVATGAKCDGLSPVTGRPTGFASAANGSPDYNALRYLAQLAVNIVDFVDLDDISTGFAWNPANPTEIVWGVEKTHLVVNEAYAEVTNDPADASAVAANSNFQVRFFLELLNPFNNNKNHTGPNATNTSPLGAGNTELNLNGQSVYRIQIFDNTSNLQDGLFTPSNAASNITGAAPAGLTPRLTVTMPAGTASIEPNDNNASNTGFRFLYPQAAQQPANTDATTYRPTANAGKDITINGTGPNSLIYTVQKQKPANIQTQTLDQVNNAGGIGKHAVLLQRLANPYMAPGPNNPYITVDSMFDIVVNDAIRVGEAILLPLQPQGTRPAPGANANANAQKSHGRRAPMYSYRGASAQASYAIDQARSFLSHNTNRFSQFEWLVHHDRKLITPLELLHVSGCKPHEVLHYFCTSATGQTDATVQAAQKHNHVTPWTQNTANLARCLEMLTVKPWTYGIPVGGRQPGRVNINAVWHKDVLQAVTDPQNGQNTNTNKGNLFTPTDVDNMWNTLFAGSGNYSRSPQFPNVGNSYDDAPTATADRPIKSFGVGAFSGSAYARQDDSIFRVDSGINKPAVYLNDATRAPHPIQQAEMLRKSFNNITTVSDTYMVVFTIGYFEIRSTGPSAGVNANRLSNMPVLGREIFNEIPGDLRVQYGAVLDRSMLALPPISTTVNPQQASNIFITELAANFDPRTANPVLTFRGATGGTTGQVLYEGQTVKLTNSATPKSDEVNSLVIGTGGTAIAIRIPAAVPPAGTDGLISIPFSGVTAYYPGTNTPVPAAQLRKFYAGEMVSSVLLGNPGPQPNFDPNSPTYRQIIRDLVPLKP